MKFLHPSIHVVIFTGWRCSPTIDAGFLLPEPMQPSHFRNPLSRILHAMFGLCQVLRGLPHETANGDVAWAGALGSMKVQVGQTVPNVPRQVAK